MLRSWRYKNGIAFRDSPRFLADGHFTRALEYEIKFLGQLMTMRLRCRADRQAGFGQTLVPNRRIIPIQYRTDRGRILGRKWPLRFNISYNHLFYYT